MSKMESDIGKMESDIGDLDSNIGEGIVNVNRIGGSMGPGDIILLDDGLLSLEQELIRVTSDNNPNEIVDVESSLDDKEILIYMEKTDKDVYTLVNDLKEFRMNHDTFVRSNNQDMRSMMYQMDTQRTQMDMHSKSLKLHSEMLTKLDSNSQEVVSAIKEMRIQNKNIFEILNKNGQQHNNNSIKEDDLNHSSNNLNSDWMNLRRPNLEQSGTPSMIIIPESIIKEDNISKNIDISNSLRDISIRLENMKVPTNSISKDGIKYDMDCDRILKDLRSRIRKSDRRNTIGESKIEVIHSDDDSSNSSSSDSSLSTRYSDESDPYIKEMILQTTLVQTCNYEGFNFRPMEREKTFNPHETLVFAITVNLLIFEEKFDETRLLFQRRKYNAKAFPNQLDLSASGYVFNKETPNEALRRIVKKELDIDLDEDLIRDMYLLAWLPNGDDNKNTAR